MIKYDKPKHITALEAISAAQKLAFAPIAFQATACLVRMGILEQIADAGDAGVTTKELADELELSEYGIRVLLDMGLSAGLVWRNDDRYVLDKIGHFVLSDKMTRINFDFVKDVCYLAMDDLDDSIRSGEPRGLRRFGDWSTLYPALTSLGEPGRSSWFAFDHFYSDCAYPAALEIVFAHPRKHILDIGGNTGRWALECVRHNPDISVTIADLPEQTSAARRIIEETGFSARIDTYDIDLLDPSQSLPKGADTLWMSQFLDCFPESEILAILDRARAIMPPDGTLFVMETLWDAQLHEAAAYSLNATSLYFTAIANGTSRMYSSADMEKLIADSGLTIQARHDNLGVGHTLLECGA